MVNFWHLLSFSFHSESFVRNENQMWIYFEAQWDVGDTFLIYFDFNLISSISSTNVSDSRNEGKKRRIRRRSFGSIEKSIVSITTSWFHVNVSKKKGKILHRPCLLFHFVLFCLFFLLFLLLSVINIEMVCEGVQLVITPPHWFPSFILG